MLSKLLIAFSIMFSSPPISYSTLFGTYEYLHISKSSKNKDLLEFKFSSMTYFNDVENSSKKCDVLVIYLAKFDGNKWENPILAYFNYSQFKQADDVSVRSKISAIDDKAYKNVSLESGIKKLKDCYYFSDAVSSEVLNDNTRSFTFGYIPVQSESFFWWNHGS